MRYSLHLDSDGRILYVTFEKYGAPSDPVVDELPEGDTYDYLYINERYIYDPLPKPEPPEPEESEWDVLNALLGVES